MTPVDPTLRDRRRVAVALAKIVTAGACWALSAIIAKVAFERGVAPMRMAEARVAVALVVLVGVLAWHRADLLSPPKGALPLLIGFGICLAAVNGAYYLAIDRLSVGVALSLQYTAPVLLLGLAVARRRDRPRSLAWLAAGCRVAGAVLVSQAYRGFRNLSGPGLAAAAASAVFFAGYLLLADAAGRRGIHLATLLVWGFVFAVATWTVAAPWWSWPWSKLGEPTIALAVLGVGLLGTLIPFFLAVGAVPVLSPATAGIAATVEPPFAATFAWVLLGQHLTGIQISGGVLVLLGIGLAQRMTSLGRDALSLEPAP